jgi:hypothetical protein
MQDLILQDTHLQVVPRHGLELRRLVTILLLALTQVRAVRHRRVVRLVTKHLVMRPPLLPAPSTQVDLRVSMVAEVVEAIMEVVAEQMMADTATAAAAAVPTLLFLQMLQDPTRRMDIQLQTQPLPITNQVQEQAV